MRSGRIALIFMVVSILGLGLTWYSTLPRFPVAQPAADLVLRQGDLPPGFSPDLAETRAITANPYMDHTEHYRSGYRAEYQGEPGTPWLNTRVVSTSFVVDRKGAERIYARYVGQVRHRGEAQPFGTLGQESHFVVARNEPSAPVVLIGVARVQNVLITLTVMTDHEMDPEVVYDWVRLLADRANPR